MTKAWCRPYPKQRGRDSISVLQQFLWISFDRLHLLPKPLSSLLAPG
jgi:hypothetical protein